MLKIPIRHIKEPDFSEHFRILNIEELLSENDMIQELHRHDFYYVLFLKKGKGEHHIDFVPYSISNHSIFFMRPGQVHSLALDKGSSGYLVQFNKDFYTVNNRNINLALRKASAKNHYLVDSDVFEKIEALLKLISQENTNQQENFFEVIKSYLYIVFTELSRNHPSAIDSDHTNQYNQERLEELLELLQNNLSTHKEVEAYARLMNLSVFQLSKITKETLGKTCLQLINEQVLLESKRNLLGTNNQIKQIAFHLGYDDVSYFIRFFKKHTGLSPNIYRNKFK